MNDMEPQPDSAVAYKATSSVYGAVAKVYSMQGCNISHRVFHTALPGSLMWQNIFTADLMWTSR